MRISDWSSDVCSSDLDPRSGLAEAGRLTRDGEVAQQVQLVPHADARAPHPTDDRLGTETESLEPVEGDLQDRKSVVKGKSVSVRVDFGGRRIMKKNKNTSC